MTLNKYTHNADSAYQEQAAFYSGTGTDFFSCYETPGDNFVNCETTFRDTFLKCLDKVTIAEDWTFMDCGCGLGHPLYLASSRFRKVIGIEINSDVARICSNNLKCMGVRNFEIINQNIVDVDYEILKQVNVFYLFNPFLNEVFDCFISNLVTSIMRWDRETWVIYANAVCEEIFANYSRILPLEYVLNDFRKICFYHHRSC